MDWIALIGGVVGLVTILAKYLYDRYKAKPRKKRIDYIEKAHKRAATDLEHKVVRGDNAGLSIAADDIVDRVTRLRKQEELDKTSKR